ncbi:MAG: ATP-dependent DNA ligase [Candidatus Methanomethylophilaceae archaeon]|nr:ATP-dependent DNA ligase [Candidatus Methanomethylophilaceae archaeon]
MDFADIAITFDKLESTSARLEMTDILAEFFSRCPAKELRSIIYLSQGKLHPDFYGVELGMADKLVLKAISLTSGKPDAVVEELWLKTGDPGQVAEQLITKKKQMTLFSEPLTLDRVIKSLTLIETAEGKDSQDRKMKHLASLLHDSGPLEARYLCRIVTGRMRVGASTMTILDALAITYATKESRPEIERAFNVTCDLGLVAETLATDGMEGISKIKVTVGDPVKVMLAERLPSIAEVVEKMGGECAIEYKYDGIRAQVHIGKDSVKIYSRRLEDLTPNFPDIAEAVKAHFKGTEAIIEGECVAVDSETGYMQSFQEVTHRRRKHGMSDAVKEIPVRIFMFDILYVDGKDMTNVPYLQRREAIKEWFDISDNVQMSTMRIVHSVQEAEDFFEDAVNARCEGVMAKSIADTSIYRAGSRGFLWIKYKKDYQESLTDSFDLTVVGAFYGMGKRAGKYGALLMATYDPETGRYGTVCKLGTGFDDAFLDNLPNLLDMYKSPEIPQSLDAKMQPDVWFQPAVVLEVVAAEITLSPNHTAGLGVLKEDTGIGIRFPRFTGRVRDDKGPDQCTTVQEIIEMYEMQSHDSDGLS